MRIAALGSVQQVITWPGYEQEIVLAGVKIAPNVALW
jgi:hypothetical protein